VLVARDSANRWTDNIHTLRSWMKKKFAGMEGQVDSFFKEVSAGIAQDLPVLWEQGLCRMHAQKETEGVGAYQRVF